MTFDPDDPRLTAYALGELDPSDHAAIEAILDECPECRQSVDEIRKTVAWLSQQLQEEKATHSQPAELNHQSAPTLFPGDHRPAPVRPRRRTRLVAFGASAAVLVIALSIGFGLLNQQRRKAANEEKFAELDDDLNQLNVVIAARSPATSLAASPLSTRAAQPVAGPAVRRGIMVADAGSSAGVAASRQMLGRRMDGSGPPPPIGGDRSKFGFHYGPVVVQEPVTVMLGKAPVKGKNPLPGLVAQSGQAGRAQSRSRDTFAIDVTGKPAGRPLQEQAASASVGAALGDRAQAGARAGEALQKPRPEQVVTATRPAPAQTATPAQEGRTVDAMLEEELAPEAPKQGEPLALAEAYAAIVDNPFQLVSQDRQSTFSIDVDTASYSNIRRFLVRNMLPPKDAVRIEEMLNYFPYHDAPPSQSSEDPFAVHVEVAGCPWNAQHRLARIGIAAKPIDQSNRPASNLVFLVDVSGSMNADNKLPLVQWGLQRLVEQLGENDRVALVVYAGASGLVLPSTSCLNKAAILSAIEQLQSGGSTNGGAGIQLAYDIAVQNFIKNGTNRVIMATDGEFNVGLIPRADLIRLIEAKAKSGVFLSVLGFGMGNIKDATLEQIADKGNGHYAYIDSPREAYKVLVEEMGSTLVNVAKDVKIQVDFNPFQVSQFRLIGYENRIMAHQDFNDDTKDAGEIGAGHYVTALYELVLPSPSLGLANLAQSDARKSKSDPVNQAESLIVRLRYKKPNEDKSRLIEQRVVDRNVDYSHASNDLKFATAVAGFGMLLRDSAAKGSLTYAGVLELAQPTLTEDPSGYRREFYDLVNKARALSSRPSQ